MFICLKSGLYQIILVAKLQGCKHNPNWQSSSVGNQKQQQQQHTDDRLAFIFCLPNQLIKQAQSYSRRHILKAPYSGTEHGTILVVIDLRLSNIKYIYMQIILNRSQTYTKQFIAARVMINKMRHVMIMSHIVF